MGILAALYFQKVSLECLNKLDSEISFAFLSNTEGGSLMKLRPCLVRNKAHVRMRACVLTQYASTTLKIVDTKPQLFKVPLP